MLSNSKMIAHHSPDLKPISKLHSGCFDSIKVLSQLCMLAVLQQNRNLVTWFKNIDIIVTFRSWN